MKATSAAFEELLKTREESRLAALEFRAAALRWLAEIAEMRRVAALLFLESRRVIALAAG